MQQHIDLSRPLLDDLIEKASGPDDKVFFVKLFLYIVLVSMGLYLILQEGFFISLSGTILVGSMFAHGVELSHQLLHGTGFKSMRLSNIAGSIMCAPMLISYRSYQLCHLRHHAFLGTKDDTEFFEFNMLEENLKWYKKFISFTMLSHYFVFFQRVIKAIIGSTLFDFLPDNLDKQCRNQYLSMLAILLVIIAISLLSESAAVIYLWVLPLLFVAGPLHTMIELPEHSGCDQSTQVVLENTRSISSNTLMTWFVNGNNYHVEHHQYPLVRPEYSSKVHEQIKHKITNRSASYRDFVYGLMAKRSRKPQAPKSRRLTA